MARRKTAEEIIEERKAKRREELRGVSGREIGGAVELAESRLQPKVSPPPTEGAEAARLEKQRKLGEVIPPPAEEVPPTKEPSYPSLEAAEAARLERQERLGEVGISQEERATGHIHA